MDIFKQAGDALSNLGRAAGKQAEVLSLQTKLGGMETELERTYAEAGKRAHELMRMRQLHDDECKVILRRAIDLKEQMMQVRQEIHELQTATETAQAGHGPPSPHGDEIVCANCGKIAAAGETFCSGCGNKL